MWGRWQINSSILCLYAHILSANSQSHKNRMSCIPSLFHVFNCLELFYNIFTDIHAQFIPNVSLRIFPVRRLMLKKPRSNQNWKLFCASSVQLVTEFFLPNLSWSIVILLPLIQSFFFFVKSCAFSETDETSTCKGPRSKLCWKLQEKMKF